MRPPQLSDNQSTNIENSIAQINTAALIDTGAQRTCISKKIISDLELLADSKTEMHAAGGRSEVNQYRVGLFIPIQEHILTGVKDGKANFQTQLFFRGSPNTLVMEFSAPEQFNCIVGMDILVHCNFFMALGEFVLSY